MVEEKLLYDNIDTHHTLVTENNFLVPYTYVKYVVEVLLNIFKIASCQLFETLNTFITFENIIPGDHTLLYAELNGKFDYFRSEIVKLYKERILVLYILAICRKIYPSIKISRTTTLLEILLM